MSEDKKGKIIFKQHGLIRTYECTCGEQPEPSEVGVSCVCGAYRSWDE